jgi:hypothetical protein
VLEAGIALISAFASAGVVSSTSMVTDSALAFCDFFDFFVVFVTLDATASVAEVAAEAADSSADFASEAAVSNVEDTASLADSGVILAVGSALDFSFVAGSEPLDGCGSASRKYSDFLPSPKNFNTIVAIAPKNLSFQPHERPTQRQGKPETVLDPINTSLSRYGHGNKRMRAKG